MLRQLPFVMVYSRVFIGLVLLLISLFPIHLYATYIVVGISLAILTDIFDGIIARQLKVDTEKIRRLDSNVDLFFWLITLFGVF